ncbi:uncharacterized protein TNCV_2399151 [Trichonephila clavipes]|uniref:Uncharacterized protein n=1 Tax=Trichonephila clavipes TaxID=2585209 RepID=A0A8X6SUW4_TRICX|nr:uncharacterized protein TNCV_2399151 [Trichonephila clavipes]
MPHSLRNTAIDCSKCETENTFTYLGLTSYNDNRISPEIRKGRRLANRVVYGRAKSIISTFIDKCPTVTQNPKSLGKPRETLASVGTIPRHLERVEAVARFRLTTENDFLGVFRHWLGQAADEVFPLCGHTRKDGNHLLQCTELDDYPTSSIGTGWLGVKCSRCQAQIHSGAKGRGRQWLRWTGSVESDFLARNGSQINQSVKKNLQNKALVHNWDV